MDDWNLRATRLLKVQMDQQGINFKELSRRLEALGVELDNARLSNKVNRGTFSLVFFLQCMTALGVDVVRLHDSELELRRRGEKIR